MALRSRLWLFCRRRACYLPGLACPPRRLALSASFRWRRAAARPSGRRAGSRGKLGGGGSVSEDFGFPAPARPIAAHGRWNHVSEQLAQDARDPRALRPGFTIPAVRGAFAPARAPSAVAKRPFSS